MKGCESGALNRGLAHVGPLIRCQAPAPGQWTSTAVASGQRMAALPHHIYHLLDGYLFQDYSCDLILYSAGPEPHDPPLGNLINPHYI